MSAERQSSSGSGPIPGHGPACGMDLCAECWQAPEIGTTAYFYSRRIVTRGVPSDEAAINRAITAVAEATEGADLAQLIEIAFRAAGETP